MKKNKLNIINNSFRRARYYFNDYFITMTVMQIIKSLLVLPAISYIFGKILDNANINSITNKNFMILFSKPGSIFFTILLLLCAVLFVFYEIGFYFLMADYQIKGRNYTFKSLLKKLNSKAKYFLSLYSLLFMVYILILLPVASIGINSTLTKNIRIPGFIKEELILTNKGKLVYLLMMIGLIYLALKLIYSIYFFIRDTDKNILKSVKESWRFSKGHVIVNFILISIVSLIYSGVVFIFLGIALLPIVISDNLFPVISPVTAGISITLVQIVIFFTGGFIVPIIANVIIYTTDPEEVLIKDTKRKPISVFRNINNNRILKRIAIVIFLGMIIFNTFTAVNIVYKPDTLIIAHRGYQKNAVENSKESVREAVKAGADAVEIDIQETKDGKFAVIHDFNLKRLAGKNRKVSDMTMEELANIEIEQNGNTANIPSLEEIIKLARRYNIRLLIEVKPHGKESADMEKNLVDLLKRYRIDNKVMVQSLDYNVIKRIKEIDPEIKTGYIVPINFGDLPKDNYDFLTIEDFSVNDRILNDAKEKNIKIIVWTINDDDSMMKYFKININGIITNYPEKAKELRNSKEYTKTFFNRVKYLLFH